jgi:hypothetical protein
MNFKNQRIEKLPFEINRFRARKCRYSPKKKTCFIKREENFWHISCLAGSWAVAYRQYGRDYVAQERGAKSASAASG